MKIIIEQIPPEQPEELLIRCHDSNAPWAARLMAAVSPEITVTGYQEDAAVSGIIVFAVIILVVDALVHGLSFGLDWILARDVNLILSQERRMEQEHRASS